MIEILCLFMDLATDFVLIGHESFDVLLYVIHILAQYFVLFLYLLLDHILDLCNLIVVILFSILTGRKDDNFELRESLEDWYKLTTLLVQIWLVLVWDSLLHTNNSLVIWLDDCDQEVKHDNE